MYSTTDDAQCNTHSAIVVHCTIVHSVGGGGPSLLLRSFGYTPLWPKGFYRVLLWSIEARAARRRRAQPVRTILLQSATVAHCTTTTTLTTTTIRAYHCTSIPQHDSLPLSAGLPGVDLRTRGGLLCRGGGSGGSSGSRTAPPTPRPRRNSTNTTVEYQRGIPPPWNSTNTTEYSTMALGWGGIRWY